MSDQVTFGGVDGSLVIRRASESTPGELVDVVVEFRSRDFSASAPTRVSVHDLAQLSGDLERIAESLRGSAEFLGTDGVFGLRYEILNGSGELSGTIQWPFALPTVRTEFELRTDQTFVSETAEALSAFLASSHPVD